MKKDKNLIILTIVFIIFATLFFAKNGSIFIDFSRESYIPYQILKNQKPMSDIFLIYGPFGYLVNVLLYKISINLNLLYFEAIMISYAILVLFYKILKFFLNSSLCLIFSIFFVTISIFSFSTFSFVFPYSFSTLWAVFGAYTLLYCLLKEKYKLAFLSLGLILANRIEFFILFLIPTTLYLLAKKECKFKYTPYITIFPIINLVFLACTKVNINDILKNLYFIKEMGQTHALTYFYKGMGVYFYDIAFIYYFKKLLIITLFLTISYVFYKKNKYLTIIPLIISLFFIRPQENFSLIFIPLLAGLIYKFIKKELDINLILLSSFSLILCSKSIFNVNSINYSNFGFTLAIISTALALNLNKNWLKIVSFFYIIILNFSNIFYYLNHQKTQLQTDVGKIYIEKKDKNKIDNTINFIKNNLKENDNILVIPEGQIFNLIAKKPHHFYNSTFTPLDFETFKEQNLLETLKKNQTNYIIYYPRNTNEYGKKNICNDWAVDFCAYILDNYNKVENFNDIIIYKKK